MKYGWVNNIYKWNIANPKVKPKPKLILNDSIFTLRIKFKQNNSRRSYRSSKLVQLWLPNCENSQCCSLYLIGYAFSWTYICISIGILIIFVWTFEHSFQHRDSQNHGWWANGHTDCINKFPFIENTNKEVSEKHNPCVGQ